MPLLGAYNASKHAVAALTDALRMELAPFGITVVLVEPGAIRTGFAARALAGLAPYRDPTSPYAPALAGTDAAWARVYRFAPGPARAGRTIARAATTARPAARYVVPAHNRLIVAALDAPPHRRRRRHQTPHHGPPSPSRPIAPTGPASTVRLRALTPVRPPTPTPSPDPPGHPRGRPSPPAPSPGPPEGERSPAPVGVPGAVHTPGCALHSRPGSGVQGRGSRSGSGGRSRWRSFGGHLAIARHGDDLVHEVVGGVGSVRAWIEAGSRPGPLVQMHRTNAAILAPRPLLKATARRHFLIPYWPTSP
jgi:hypothetical protein